MWEQWDPGCSTAPCSGASVSQTSTESFSHGWGAVGITSVLRGLLGITVTSPGAATVTIAPPGSGLTQASGSEWTERGQVIVSWTGGANNTTLDVTIPTNQTAIVSLPAPSGQSYTATGAGAPIYIGLQNGRLVYQVGSGRTHFAPA
jgi:hypothetical protein